ncbi:hypothetical protein BY996DRAFT_6414243 [Phakopsora pachyrhizi]|uniref:Expressed protein n=1 Tax=Phakopsora pachyrhizi TaxID=170000 RepID=A0AAV0BTH1_PHAPC|nr:hypothetical protein BY996DRAFT_6414243 [Phakopsora pachyrhizi]CAH7690806.1 expressed protein [Phakopsora pachyrhizi]
MRLRSVTVSVSALALTVSATILSPMPQSPRRLERQVEDRIVNAAGLLKSQESNRLRVRRFSSWPKLTHGDMLLHHRRRLNGRGNNQNNLVDRSTDCDKKKHAKSRKVKAKIVKEETDKKEKAIKESEKPRITPPNVSSNLARDVKNTNTMLGFVEVAVPAQKAGFSQTVSGLTYSMRPSSSEPSYEIRTSRLQSSPFYMSPQVDVAAGSPTYYQLKAPSHDRKKSDDLDHCVTYGTSSEKALWLAPCGLDSTSSQWFTFNSDTGELRPVHGRHSSGSRSSDDENDLVLIKRRSLEFGQKNDKNENRHSQMKKSSDKNTSNAVSQVILYFVHAVRH